MIIERRNYVWQYDLAVEDNDAEDADTATVENDNASTVENENATVEDADDDYATVEDADDNYATLENVDDDYATVEDDYATVEDADDDDDTVEDEYYATVEETWTTLQRTMIASRSTTGASISVVLLENIRPISKTSRCSGIMTLIILFFELTLIPLLIQEACTCYFA